jgi:hypothetical protein
MPLISKQFLEEIKKMEGEIIGSSLKTDREFIIEKEGIKGLEKLETEMEELGYPLKQKEIDKYKWYPVQQDFLSLLLAQKIFNWSDRTIREWGRWGAKTNFIIKLMARLVSKETISKLASKYWRRYYTKGIIEYKLDYENRIGIVTIKDFIIYPVHLHYLEGYFYQIMSLMVPSQNLKVEGRETGELDVHQFEITW